LDYAVLFATQFNVLTYTHAHTQTHNNIDGMVSDLRLGPIENRSAPEENRSSPPPQYSSTEERVGLYAGDEDLEHGTTADVWDAGHDFDDTSEINPRLSQANLLMRLCVFIGISWTIGLYSTYPSPTTVPVFIGSAFIITSWAVFTWSRLLLDLAQRKQSIGSIMARWSLRHRVGLGLATALVFWWAMITLFSGAESQTPARLHHGDKYFIAVNLHNNEAILDNFITEMTLLSFHRESCLNLHVSLAHQ
jgi:hypothetical protein